MQFIFAFVIFIEDDANHEELILDVPPNFVMIDDGAYNQMLLDIIEHFTAWMARNGAMAKDVAKRSKELAEYHRLFKK